MKKGEVMKNNIEQKNTTISNIVSIIANITVIISAIISVFAYIKSNVNYKSDIDITFYSKRAADGFGNIFIVSNNTNDKVINDLCINFDDGIFILDNLFGDARVSFDEEVSTIDNTIIINNLNPGDYVDFSFATDQKLYIDKLKIYSKDMNKKYEIDINNQKKKKILSELLKYLKIVIISMILPIGFSICNIYVLLKKSVKHGNKMKSKKIDSNLLI